MDVGIHKYIKGTGKQPSIIEGGKQGDIEKMWKRRNHQPDFAGYDSPSHSEWANITATPSLPIYHV